MIFLDSRGELWLYDDGTFFNGKERIRLNNYSLSKFVREWKFKPLGWL